MNTTTTARFRERSFIWIPVILVMALLAPAIAGQAASRVDDNRPLPPSMEPNVRVKVRSFEVGSGSLAFGSEGQRLLILAGEPRRPFLLEAPLEISSATTGWFLRDAGGRERTFEPLTELAIRTLVDDASGIVQGEMVLPGTIALVPVPRGEATRLDMITTLPVEAYLPGVLDAELFANWPLATFEAQSVAARSFAVAEAAFWKKRRTYDVVAGPSSQAWSGLAVSDKAIEAVDSTRGMVLVHDGRVIPAYYSSVCGGMSASAVDAISNRDGHRIEPLQARASDRAPCCEEASLRTWTAKFDLGTLRNHLRAWGREHGEQGRSLQELGRLRSMRVHKRNPSGRPRSYELVDRSGTRILLDADTLRRALGSAPRAGNGEPRSRSMYSESFQPTISGRTLTLEGRGFGHGVGLCQYGARQMAADGAPWERILARYYPGAQVIRAWSGR